MRGIRRVLLSTGLLLTMLACGPKQATFVLLPDLDGSTGTMEIITDGGSQVITRPEEAVTVTDIDQPPSAPRAMSPMEILSTFRDVWQVRPEEPIHYFVYFKQGTSDLTRDSLALIPKMLDAIAERKSSSIHVIGHTDTEGSRELNARLSLERAEAVRDILIPRGIDSSYLEVTSHGEEDLLIKTGDEVAEPLNRRVEVIIK